MQNFDFLQVITFILKNAPIIIALFLIHFILKYKRPLLNAIKSALPGTICLALLNALSGFTGIAMPINGASFGISALLGLPGVGIITILNTLFSA